MKIVLWLLNCLWVKLWVMLLAVFMNYFAAVGAFRRSRWSKLRKMIFHLFISRLVYYYWVWIGGVFVLGVTYVDFEMDFLPKVIRTGQEFSIQGKFKLLQSSPARPPPPPANPFRTNTCRTSPHQPYSFDLGLRPRPHSYAYVPLPPPPNINKWFHPDKRICIKGGDIVNCIIYTWKEVSSQVTPVADFNREIWRQICSLLRLKQGKIVLMSE